MVRMLVARGEIAIDQIADGILPGGNLLVNGVLAASLVRFVVEMQFVQIAIVGFTFVEVVIRQIPIPRVASTRRQLLGRATAGTFASRTFARAAFASGGALFALAAFTTTRSATTPPTPARRTLLLVGRSIRARATCGRARRFFHIEIGIFVPQSGTETTFVVEIIGKFITLSGRRHLAGRSGRTICPIAPTATTTSAATTTPTALPLFARGSLPRGGGAARLVFFTIVRIVIQSQIGGSFQRVIEHRADFIHRLVTLVRQIVPKIERQRIFFRRVAARTTTRTRLIPTWRFTARRFTASLRARRLGSRRFTALSFAALSFTARRFGSRRLATTRRLALGRTTTRRLLGTWARFFRARAARAFDFRRPRLGRTRWLGASRFGRSRGRCLRCGRGRRGFFRRGFWLGGNI